MRITRRSFLQSTGALAACGAVNPLHHAIAQTVGHPLGQPITQPITQNKTLVVVFLRGGIDGLNWIVPYADPHYAKLRPTLQVNRPGQPDGALDLDGFFGVNPRAHRLMPWFNQGLCVAAHAVGYAGNSRSHFEEQDVWETGTTPGRTTPGGVTTPGSIPLSATGWLNRHLLTSHGHGPIRALALADSLPRILRGDAPAYALSGGEIHETHETREGLDALRRIADQPHTPRAHYPTHGKLGQRCAAAARLIKADLGVEIIQIDDGGWDTHNQQGNGAQGGYGDKLQELSDALAALAEDLGPRLRDTLILTLSDFGRTAAENATAGTDHGHANAMLALGGPVQHLGVLASGGTNSPTTPGRRKVLTHWPGLSPDQLHDHRALAHTLDFRDLLAEVVRIHLGNPNLPTLFPGHAFKAVGLVG